jgi:hypothetical protein
MQARVCFTFILGLNLLIVEDPTVTVKCGTAIKALFLYMNLYLYVMLDSLSFSFISIPSLINQLYFKNEFTSFFSYRINVKLCELLFGRISLFRPSFKKYFAHCKAIYNFEVIRYNVDRQIIKILSNVCGGKILL